MKGEVSREPHYFTSGEYINKKEIVLSGWPINTKAQHRSRAAASGTLKAKALLKRMEQEGTR